MTRRTNAAAQLFDISIHTPARGVTEDLQCLVLGLVISIHTPARGVTREALESRYLKGISIHTPARGVTVAPDVADIILAFQSTLPHGE